MQFVHLAINNQRMARVMPTLKTCNDIRPLTQSIDNLAFTFVAPLSANNNHVRHAFRPFSLRQTRVRIERTSDKRNTYFAATLDKGISTRFIFPNKLPPEAPPISTHPPLDMRALIRNLYVK